jgi:hypothetical protein
VIQSRPASFSERADQLAVLGLIASIVLIPITRSIQLPIVGPRLTIFEIAAAPTIALWVIARTLSRSWGTVQKSPALDLPLIGFWCVALLSGITAYHTLGASGTVTFLTEMFVLTYLVLFFVSARDLLIRHHRLATALQAWGIAAIVVGVVGIIGIGEMVRCEIPLSSLVYSNARLLSTFRNPNQLAAYMVPTCAVLVGLCASRLARRRRVLAMTGVALSAAVLFFSASRGGAVATAAGLMLLALLQRSASMWRTIGAIVALVVVLAGVSVLAVQRGNRCLLYLNNTITAMTVQLPVSLRLTNSMLRGAEPPGVLPVDARRGPGTRPRTSVEAPELAVEIPMGSDTATSFAFRGVMARVALRFALDHPLTGVGLGTMHLHVWQLTHQTADVDAHNMAMTVLAETGFVGLALFAWCIGWCAWTALIAFSQAAGDPLRALRAGLLVALLAFLVMTLSFDGQRQRVLWTLLAVIYASAQAGALSTVGREADRV